MQNRYQITSSFVLEHCKCTFKDHLLWSSVLNNNFCLSFKFHQLETAYYWHVTTVLPY